MTSDRCTDSNRHWFSPEQRNQLIEEVEELGAEVLFIPQYQPRANAIEPGWIDTPGERQFTSDEEMERAAPGMPWGRLGTPADIGRAAAYLASDAADYVTGTVLRVDGGLTLKR